MCYDQPANADTFNAGGATLTAIQTAKLEKTKVKKVTRKPVRHKRYRGNTQLRRLRFTCIRQYNTITLHSNVKAR